MIRRSLSRARVGADRDVDPDVGAADALGDKKLWYYDPASKVADGNAPNGFKQWKATLVNTMHIDDDTKQIAAVRFVENGPGGYGRGEGEIVTVLAASSTAGTAPKVGDYVDDATPRQKGKQGTVSRAMSTLAEDTPIILVGLVAVGAVFLLTRK